LALRFFLQRLLAALRLLVGGGLHGCQALGLGRGLLGAGLLLLLLGRLHVGGAVGVGHDILDEQHDAALAVRGLVLVDDALRGGTVHETAGGERGGVGLGAVAGGHGVLHAAGRGLELALHRAVAHAGLLVGDDALLLAFDVRHVVRSSKKIVCLVLRYESRCASSDTGGRCPPRGRKVADCLATRPRRSLPRLARALAMRWKQAGFLCFADQSVTSEDESVMQPRLQIWR